MGFFSGIVHAIAHGVGDVENFFGAGPKKKQQNSQNQAQPQNQPQAPQNQSNFGSNQSDQNFRQNNPQVFGQPNEPAQTPDSPFHSQLTLLNKQQPTPDPATLQKAAPKAAPAQHESILGQIGNAVSSPFRPLGEGIARLLPGGQNDIKANDATIAQNNKSLEFYAQQHKAGKLNDDVYKKALASVSQGSQLAGQEAKRIGDTADRSKVIGSALATASAPFTASVGIGGSLLSKVAATGGVGLLEGANNELSSNANPTLKGALQQGAIGGLTAGALPVLGSVAAPALRKVVGGVANKAAPVIDALTEAGQNAKGKISNAVDRVNAATDGLLPPQFDNREVSAGIKSVNPNGQQDVADHLVQNHLSAEAPAPKPVEAPVAGPNGEVVPQISHEAPNAQAPQIEVPPEPVAPAPDPLAPKAIDPNSLNEHETAALKLLNETQKTRKLTPDELNMRQALQAKSDEIQAHNNPEAAPAPAPVAPAPRETPQYTSPHKNGKASVPGNNGVGYATGDKNLDGIVNDSIIAHKGTAATADTRAAALDSAGITNSQRAQIRDIATKNVDKETGQISEAGVAKIKAVMSKSSTPAATEQVTPPTATPEATPATGAPIADDARTAPNAPNVFKKAQKDLSEAIKGNERPNDVHEVLSNPEITARGKAVADTFSDEEVVSRYENSVSFNNTHDIAIANASKDRLSTIIRNAAKSGDEEAQKEAQNALNNIIDGSAEVQSRGGQILNYGQEMLKNLPPEQRAAYYVTKIDKANIAKLGDKYDPIAENPTRREAVQARLTELFTKDEELRSEIAAKQSVTEKTLDESTRGDVTLKEAQAAQAEKAVLEQTQRENAGDMVKYYSELLPKQSLAEKAGDWQRTAMLSSPSGRGRAIAGTGLNVADTAAKQGLSGLLGKVNNALTKDPNSKVNSTGTQLGPLLKGVVSGAKKSFNSARGNFEVENPEKAINADPQKTLSAMNRFTSNPVSRAVGAVVESHSNMTEGLVKSELQRAAHTEAVQQGLKGEDLQKYVIGRTESPTTHAAAKADETWKEVNNLNKNKLSSWLQDMGKSAERNFGAPGKIIKNQILPFPTFLGGNIYNAVTDKNVVAAAIKVANSALRGGSRQEVIDNIAKLGVEGGKTYALGWVLTQKGLIVNKDANGKDYDGAYLKLGSRYVPVRDFGFFAPSIVLGNAAYQGFHDHKGDPAGAISEAAAKTLGNSYRTLSGQSVMNPTASVGTPVSQAFPNSGQDALGKLAKVGANVVGQNIPAAFGDVNSILNQSHLDPTHEAADTKETHINPKTGKAVTDPGATAKNTLLNKLPITSQNLPRKAGEAAADPLDKFLASTRDTPTTIKDRAVKLSQEQQIASYAKDTNKTLDPLNTDSAVLKAVENANKKSFEASGKKSATINGVLYEKNVKGGTTTTSSIDHAFQTSQGNVDPVQRAKDTETFKKSGKQQDTINGTVYERSDDGKVKATEQKDYDYKQSNDRMTQAVKSGDFTGYKTHSTNLLENIGQQLQNPKLSKAQSDALVSKAMEIQHKSAEYDAYDGFTKPPKAETFKGIGQLNNARQYTPEESKKYNGSSGFVEEIQRNAAKYGVEGNALLAVAAMEGLGGGVGDGGHAFGPFQMNDAGGVLTGKFKSPEEARNYAESPAGIEDAVRQIAAVSKGLKGKAAIDAIVRNFERPADPDKEVYGAGEVYDGGKADLSASGSAAITEDYDKAAKRSASANAAAKLIKDNTVSSPIQLQQTSFGQLAPKKVTSQVPILQKILPSDLVKQRTISVSRAK
jgi:hypothetical protein